MTQGGEKRFTMAIRIPAGSPAKERPMIESVFSRLHGYYLEDITEGMSAVTAKTITDADVTLFAGVSGDTNPLHINEAFARETRFKTRIVHGMLTTSLWSTLIGTQLPGPGSAYLKQETTFTKPVHAGETVTATVKVARIDREKQRVYLDCECTVDGAPVAVGKSVAWVPRRAQTVTAP
jgi:3-hydroxybutyryl-CoA dehydratase